MTERMYMVRAGERGSMIDDFLNNHIIAIGWDDIGDLSSAKTFDQIRELVIHKYPNYSKGHLGMTTGQLFRFRTELAKENYIITYDPENRIYSVGKITGDYQYKNERPKYKHIRTVEWKWEVKRDALSVAAKNSLGAIMTLFEVWDDNVKNEILSIVKSGGKSVFSETLKEENEQIGEIKKSIMEQSVEFIKDKLVNLDPYDMQDLVAGILRSMGYKTLVSPKGSDRGKDIVASPDGLGLEDPKIIVQVKHREGAMGREAIASFIGGLRNEKGLYVSTGGFTKDAKYEAERAQNPITLIDFDLLVKLILDNYDKFDQETRELIPLTKIYWLISEK